MFRLNRLVVLLLLVATLAAHAQAPGKVVNVGVMLYGWSEREVKDPLGSDRLRPAVTEFLRSLRERGWAEGANLRLHWRSPGFKPERVSQVMDELARIPVDVLVVSGNLGALDAKKRALQIPVVTIAAYHPDEYGIVQSIAKPGGMITGALLEPGRGINQKRIALLKEALPRLKRLAYIDTDLTQDVHAEVQHAASVQDVVAFPVSWRNTSSPRFAEAFEEAKRLKADAILVGSTTLYELPEIQAQIHGLAIRHRLPAMHCLYAMAESGGLIAYATDQRENWRIAARLADRILRGAKPGDLPMEQTEHFELLVNLKAAKAIGLKLPPSFLAHADRIIQ